MGPLLELLRDHAERAPDALAITAPGHRGTTYSSLIREIERFTRSLRDVGVGPSDRVALAVPNGPDLALASLAVISAAVCAPFAMDQPTAEVALQLDRVGASAVLVAHGHETPVRDAAAALGIPVLELDEGASIHRSALHHTTAASPASLERSGSDTALLLFTSGTTSAPKLVPITEHALVTSAANVAATLALGPEDRCLNVMPLFHIHGLVAALLASLVSGGSVVCTGGFVAGELPGWLAEQRPTWYTAVPTIHQAILDTVRRRAATGEPLLPTFRVIRSSSAALPVRVLEQLEAELGAPVVEAYGMTEAAHQMTSNPLGDARKPGTVGTAAGPEVAVLDDVGRELTAGEIGEIGIRGPTVTSGYLGDPQANASAFVNGWFRTGDQGRFDADRFLTITGRLKEIINRGGEKVAPREIDVALLAHGEVVHAAAFAVPHPTLGEDIAAAVVLSDGAITTGPQLRVFAGQRLAPSKVPRRVLVVDEIPKGRTGKLERTKLAALLGLDGTAGGPTGPIVPPTDAVEHQLVGIWQHVLGIDEPISIDIDFFELGGDSLHATELLDDIETNFGRHLPATTFLTGATVREMAAALRQGTEDPGASVVPVQPHGSKPPLFCLLRGGSVVAVRHLAAALGPDQPTYALWYPTMHGPPSAAGSIEDIASECADAAVAVGRVGPFSLFGHSLGGVVIFEVARQLVARGHEVGAVILADSFHPQVVDDRWRRQRAERSRYRARHLLSRRGPTLVVRRIQRVLGRRSRNEVLAGTSVPGDYVAAIQRERAYQPGPASVPLTILATQAFLDIAGTRDLGWAPVAAAGWETFDVPGNHDTMLGEPHVRVLGARVASTLDQLP